MGHSLQLSFMTQLWSMRRPTSCSRCMSQACDSNLDDYLEACRAMKISELKAELDMRGVSYAGLFEKDELVTRLARARRRGEADPSLIDTFNKQSVEQAWQASSPPAEAVKVAVKPEDVTAGDG